MLFAERRFVSIVASAAAGVILLSCSEQHPAPKTATPTAETTAPSLSKADALAIAHTAALKEGMNLSAFGPPQANPELLDGRWRWVVFYPGVEDKPGNFFNVLIDDATKSADLIDGE
ncbi:MAG: hypothetical protein JSR73_19310 [Proteobacteria bacterium]|nr:hypothetical protein [Pseudomonadota bacterium]